MTKVNLRRFGRQVAMSGDWFSGNLWPIWDPQILWG